MPYLFLLLALLLSPISFANNQLIQPELIQLETRAHKLSSNFAAFIYFQGQPHYLLQAVKHAEKGLNDTPLAIKNHDQQKLIKNLWLRSIDFISENKSHSFDGIEMRLEAGWSLLSLELSEEIKKLNMNSNAKNSSPDLYLKLELARLLAQYMMLANATTGGYGISRSEDTIEHKVGRISQQFAKLEHAKKAQLNKKWSYIKKTILDYNSNVAPFIVIRVMHSLERTL